MKPLNPTTELYLLFHHLPPAFSLPAIYLPMHCGYLGELEGYPYLTDRTGGDFVSAKADYYSELSGIYWAWKNSNADIIGSCHYRRFFSTSSFPIVYRLKKYLFAHWKIKVNVAPRKTVPPTKIERFLPFLLDEKTIQTTLATQDAILPAPLILKVSVRTHYHQHHQSADLDLLEKIIREKHPDYVPAFEEVMEGHELYPYNMFVLNREIFDQFIPWWFGVLEDFERQVDLSKYTGYQTRILGYLSERVLTVWFKKNNHLRITEFPLLFFKKLKKD
jgi:hypothetical protein